MFLEQYRGGIPLGLRNALASQRGKREEEPSRGLIANWVNSTAMRRPSKAPQKVML